MTDTTKPCSICGRDSHDYGRKTPLCVLCEVEWAESPERAEAGTARQRFVERRQKERAAPRV